MGLYEHKYTSVIGSEKQEAKESVKTWKLVKIIMAPHIPKPLHFVAEYISIKNLAIMDLFICSLIIFEVPFYRN